VLLDLYFAMQTKRIRVGRLGIVLPASNPIRVAEDIAMLDHMTGGHANAGFARGYQRRWVDVMAQQTHGIHGALPNQHDEIDEANRQALEENFRIVKKCWTEEMLTFDGKFWKVPAGPTPWILDTLDPRHDGEVGQGRAGRRPDRRASAALISDGERLSCEAALPRRLSRARCLGRISAN
jgi:alkanesulfonate monooxygenase SsuD/methylene tetrahydromethanopterin reductase-like flavin-dependent oxidoreductase (luciferase family)